jgi:hypothetical protein
MGKSSRDDGNAGCPEHRGRFLHGRTELGLRCGTGFRCPRLAGIFFCAQRLARSLK